MKINYNLHPHAKGHETRVITDKDGTLRYKPNRIVTTLLKVSGKLDLNDIWSMYYNDCFTLDEMMEFYRLIGYTLEGFEEIWYEKDPVTAQTREEQYEPEDFGHHEA